MHEILEDHLVEPSELTVSDRPMEIPAASTEKGPYWDVSAMIDHIPSMSQYLLSPRHDPLDCSSLISFQKEGQSERLSGRGTAGRHTRITTRTQVTVGEENGTVTGNF